MEEGTERIFEIEKIVNLGEQSPERSRRKDKIGHNYRNERKENLGHLWKEDNRRNKVKIREKKMEASWETVRENS